MEKRTPLGDLTELFPSLPGFCRNFRAARNAELRRGVAARVGPPTRPTTIPKDRPRISLPPRRQR